MKFLTSDIETETVKGCTDQAAAELTGALIMQLIDSVRGYPNHIAHSALGNAFMIFSLNSGVDRQSMLDFINVSLDMNEKLSLKGDVH